MSRLDRIALWLAVLLLRRFPIVTLHVTRIRGEGKDACTGDTRYSLSSSTRCRADSNSGVALHHLDEVADVLAKLVDRVHVEGLIHETESMTP